MTTLTTPTINSPTCNITYIIVYVKGVIRSHPLHFDQNSGNMIPLYIKIVLASWEFCNIMLGYQPKKTLMVDLVCRWKNDTFSSDTRKWNTTLLYICLILLEVAATLMDFFRLLMAYYCKRWVYFFYFQ